MAECPTVPAVNVLGQDAHITFVREVVALIREMGFYPHEGSCIASVKVPDYCGRFGRQSPFVPLYIHSPL